MANSILGGMRELLLANSELERYRVRFTDLTRTSIYLQAAPQGLDLTGGIVIVLEDLSNLTDRTTESRMFESNINIIFFGTDPDLLVETILPLLFDILDDEESRYKVNQHEVHNCEILNFRLMLEEGLDGAGNNIYALSVECKVDSNRIRKGSE